MGERKTRVIGALLIATTALVAGGAITTTAATARATASGPKVTSLTLRAATSYQPRAPHGGTDDYHCTLVNPHLKKNVFIVSSLFQPNSPEVHHEITFVVPPALASEARAADHNGKGWTCFGESALQGTGFQGAFDATPTLTGWAPGHGKDVEPAGTGSPFQAGSLLVMQEHYNLLVGHKPVRSSLTINTVPSATPLRPLSGQPLPAPPDVPCPTGATGPMCSRSAELASIGQRFGGAQEGFVNGLEAICGRNFSNPPVGDTTSCTWPVAKAGSIVRLGAHMHLLGQSLKIVLDQGTPNQKVLLDVKDYNFHYQRGYNLATPVPVTTADKLTVTCTYNPALELQLPILRKIPPHFVTWGDGSTDEMCLGSVVTKPPNSEAESVALARAFTPSN
jgi:hypothetical protein